MVRHRQRGVRIVSAEDGWGQAGRATADNSTYSVCVKRDALAVRGQQGICLECRTIVKNGDGCDAGPRHRVVSLADGGGREALARTVWGPMSTRKQRALAAKSSGAGGGLGAIDSCSACDIAGAEASALTVIGIAVLTGAVVWGGYRLITYLRRRAHRLLPMGAAAGAPRLGPPTFVGVVRATEPSIAAPLSGSPCVGWAVAFAVKRRFRHHITLRDGYTNGFTLVLDDGREVLVRPGRLRLELTPKQHRVMPGERQANYLLSLMPRLDDGDGYAFVPADVALEDVVVDGERISIHANMEETLDVRRDGGRDYRHAAPVSIATVGTVGVRRIRGK